MSDKRLTTATIDGISYKLGEELNVNLANKNTAGIIKVGTTTNDYKTESSTYPLGIDNAGIGYVKITDINSSVSNNIGIASSTKPGLVLIPSNSGLKIDPENGSLVINLQTGYGIGKSQSDSNNLSYLKLEAATNNSLGGIKVVEVNSSKANLVDDDDINEKTNYGIKLDSSNIGYVTIPKIHSKKIENSDGIIKTDNEIKIVPTENNTTYFVDCIISEYNGDNRYYTVNIDAFSNDSVHGDSKTVKKYSIILNKPNGVYFNLKVSTNPNDPSYGKQGGQVIWKDNNPITYDNDIKNYPDFAYVYYKIDIEIYDNNSNSHINNIFASWSKYVLPSHN